MKRLLIIPIGLLILLAAAMMWSGGGGAGHADFTFINRGDIGTLDPNRMSWMQDIRVGYALWEGLYALDPVTLEPTPGAADRIELSPDRLTYSFHLRDNGRWSDGTPVTADDFLFAWKRMLQEPGDYTYLLYYISGAQEYEKAFERWSTQRAAAYDAWQAACRAMAADHRSVPERAADAPEPELAGVSISVDRHSMKVTLKHPVSYFPDVCAFPPMFPLYQASMERFEQSPQCTNRDEFTLQLSRTGRRSYDKGFTRPPHLITNGPYALESWAFKKTLRLRKNPCYWDQTMSRKRSRWSTPTIPSGRSWNTTRRA